MGSGTESSTKAAWFLAVALKMGSVKGFGTRGALLQATMKKQDRAKPNRANCSTRLRPNTRRNPTSALVCVELLID